MSASRNRLLAKICALVALGVVSVIAGFAAGTRFCSNEVRFPGLGILDTDLVATTGCADLGAASHVEEGSTKKYLERRILNDLDLEVDRDGT